MAEFHLTLRRHFVADHAHDMPGFVEPRHGHNWELEATVVLEDPGREGAFAEALDAWVRCVDYTCLNEQPILADRNPTTERVALWAFDYLRERGFEPQRVKVREKANYWAACSREAS
jgi:6-pyruvoyl-tetrahydropterin synthase